MTLANPKYPSGLVLWVIIKQKTFKSSKLWNREGADVDESNLIEALSPFQVDMRIWEDKTRHEILTSLKGIFDEVNMEPNKYSGLVILGMSHGLNVNGRDCLLASDCKPVRTDTIISLFHNEFCVGLKNRPKGFLFNMCRGSFSNMDLEEMNNKLPSLTDLFSSWYSHSGDDPKFKFFKFSKNNYQTFEEELAAVRGTTVAGIENTSFDVRNETLEKKTNNKSLISFKKGDYMLVHSTIKGYVSNRHHKYGSIFVLELTKSIVEMMSYDNHNFEEVVRRTCLATSQHQFSGVTTSQLPEFTTTLRAPFRFVLRDEYKNENSQLKIGHDTIPTPLRISSSSNAKGQAMMQLPLKNENRNPKLREPSLLLKERTQPIKDKESEKKRSRNRSSPEMVGAAAVPKSWACCAMNCKCGSCCTANVALITFTTAITLTGISFIVFNALDACDLDLDNFMPATKLRRCLNTLGSNGTERVEYIDIHYGNTDYLDQVCGSINEDFLFDLERTENQMDMCLSNHTAYMYPSNCNQSWIGGDCISNCTFDNYEGFFCKRSATTAPSSTVQSTTTTSITTSTIASSPTTTTNHAVYYETLYNTTCNSYGDTFDNLDDAKSFCNKDILCCGILDYACEEDGDIFDLCHVGTIDDNNFPNCVYKKISIS